MALLDHNDPDSDESIEVTFAVLSAAGERKGALVVAVGGPGASGVFDSDFFLPSFPEEITESYDLIFFDQRGVELFPGPSCPEADEAWSIGWEELAGQPDTYWDGLIDLNEVYVSACVAELGNTGVLAHLGTVQAVHDLETFREEMGYERMILYGESYGSSFAQVYAATYPERVERMVLDGVLDLTRDGLETTADQIEGLEDTLSRIFEHCDREELCRDDMGMPAAAGYETLIDRLAAEPTVVSFPTEPGLWEDIPLTVEDVSYLAYISSYSEEDRMAFLRALASAVARDNLNPMIRLFALNAGADLSAAVNQTVTCLDQPIPGADPTSEIETVSAARDSADIQNRWFYEFALDCAFWPGVNHGDDIADAYPVGQVPTLVVASDTDPATPYSHARNLVGELDSGHLLTVRGGSHVMFGRGYPCVDDTVAAFLLDGTPPITDTCSVEAVAPYLPLLPLDRDELGSNRLIHAVDDELFSLPELFYWDGFEELALGCDHGGGATFAGTPAVTEFALDACALTPDLVVDGSGSWNFVKGVSRLEITVAGCDYRYKQLWETGEETLQEECA
jgi:pimeloyl-ACP methyl ester carboxylesterase